MCVCACCPTRAGKLGGRQPPVASHFKRIVLINRISISMVEEASSKPTRDAADEGSGERGGLEEVEVVWWGWVGGARALKNGGKALSSHNPTFIGRLQCECLRTDPRQLPGTLAQP